MSKCFVYSKNPLCRRLSQIKVPISMIVAEKSFVPFISGDEFGSLVGSGGHSEFIVSFIGKYIVLVNWILFNIFTANSWSNS